MGNIKGRHPMRELKQLDKEKYENPYNDVGE